MPYRKGWITLLTLLFSVSVVGLFPTVWAESYSLTPSPTRTQESNSPGVSLSLSVSGATIGSPYSFTWAVVDPSGDNKTAVRGLIATQSSFVVSVNYPADFGGGASIQYVGTYSVNVLQTSPSLRLAASGQFEAGLTDLTSYQRTFPVSIRATGYDPNDNVTVDIRRGGISAQGFPRNVFADGGGNIVDTWLTGPSTPTGNYTISLTGANTQPKSPLDIQTFLVYPTNVTITQIAMPVSSLQKTEMAEFTFSASYLTGGPVQTGSAVLRIAEPDGTSHFAVANWNSTRGLFVANYRIPLSSQTGIWVATIDVNNFDDGYGNGGPSTSPLKGFTVTPATLRVSVSVANGTRTVGDIILVYATITSPDGSSFYRGNVTVQFSLSGRPVGNQIVLAYDQSQTRWIGSYTVRENDPSGAWLVQVSASDSYGNDGQGSASTLVSVPAQQSPVTSWWFLSLIGALAAGIVLGLLLFKKKRVFRRELRVDLQAVGREADRVKNQDFFKSLQEQLTRKKSNSGETSDG